MSDSGKQKPHRPWWTYAVPYVGRMPDLKPRQWHVLGLLSAAELFDNYDVGLLLLALKQIQEGIGISEADVGWLTGVIRLGVLPALGITLMADRIGRRRLLLGTVLGLTLCTFLTGFAQTPLQFVALQFLVRTFAYAETALAVVVLTEELNSEDRGWGIGMLGALGSLGHGVAALAFGFIEVVPFGWRGLYALGVVPLLFLAWLRRELPETRRFESHQNEHAAGSWWQPAVLLVRSYPRRIAALSAVVLPLEFVMMTGYTFAPKSLQEIHGYGPGAISVLYLLGGAIGIMGSLFAGRMSDRFGRRAVVVAGVILAFVSFGGFYNVRGSWVVIPFWIFQVFALIGLGATLKTLGTELFPTSHRSTASGVRAAIGTLGGVAGLALESVLYGITGSHAQAITWMLPVLAIPPLVVWFAIPETAGRSLEEISPER
ncbi:MAG: MFS transporter [Deltaproteobacteria bacterium]|nr:MFS transporter [Deltaproteobacteria bacterium]MBW2395708.1 MFS transporter [Deltaproteobacteria bacterium]